MHNLIKKCSEFWRGLALRDESFTIVNAASLVVYMLKNDIKIKNKCTELSFTASDLPCLKLISSRVLSEIIFNRLNRSFFTNVTCQMLGRIFGHSELYEAVTKNTNAIYPEITIASQEIQVEEWSYFHHNYFPIMFTTVMKCQMCLL